MTCEQTPSIVERSLARLILESVTPFSSLVPVNATRTLSLRAYGKGCPLIFFPGHLNSRLFSPAWDQSEELAIQTGVRVITCDRCGVGRTSGPPCTTYSEWAVVISDLLHVLNLSSVAVAGYSSGGPFAMAVAAALPDKVKSLHLISTDGPYVQIPSLTFLLERNYYSSEPLTQELAEARTRKNMATLRNAYENQTNPVRKALALADLEEATCTNILGCTRDAFLESRAWDFDPSTIQCPVFIHHGDEDMELPVVVADALSEMMSKHVSRQIYGGENHTLIRRHWRSILKIVASSMSNL